jgi:hypothetical protein
VSSGLRVAAGRAAELEQARPFGLVAGMFGCSRSAPDPRRAAIGELLATGDRGPVTVTSDPGLQFRVVDAFADLAEELALDGPLVIGADDLHWADPSSLVTLGALAARLDGLPAAIIGCFGPAPAVAGLERLGQHHPDRAFGREPGRRGAVQSADRRAPVHLEPDRADAPRARLRQAGHSARAQLAVEVTRRRPG